MIAEMSFNVFCQHLPNEYPVYRIWCNETLITERKFIWDTHDKYLNEMITVDVPDGSHNKIEIDNISKIGQIKIDDVEVISGSATFDVVCPPLVEDPTWEDRAGLLKLLNIE